MKKIKTVALNSMVFGTFFVMALGVTAAQADKMTTDKQKVVHSTASQQVQKAQKKVNDKAAKGIQLIYKALSEISNDNLNQAKATLVDASTALENAAKIGEDFLTVNASVDMEIGVETPETAAELMRLAEEAIELNNPQAARDLLITLVSEIDVTTTEIPVTVFKDYTDKAIVAIDKKEKDKAEQNLLDAMDTAIFTSEVIPVPALFAEMDLDEASETVVKDPERALNFLKDAEQQMALNDILGYNRADAFQQKYKTVRKRILSAHHSQVLKNIKNKIKGIAKSTEKDTNAVGKKIKESIGKLEKHIEKK